MIVGNLTACIVISTISKEIIDKIGSFASYLTLTLNSNRFMSCRFIFWFAEYLSVG